MSMTHQFLETQGFVRNVASRHWTIGISALIVDVIVEVIRND